MKTTQKDIKVIEGVLIPLLEKACLCKSEVDFRDKLIAAILHIKEDRIDKINEENSNYEKNICVVCHINPVDSDAGFDTCSDCYKNRI
jgi:mannose/fructose-specific phosphotransferase system component IIA